MFRTRWLVVMAVCAAVIVGAILGGGVLIASKTGGNCQRIHQLVRTLDTIIQSGDAQVRRYVSEGTLTPEQGRRADAEREKARTKLASADCQ